MADGHVTEPPLHGKQLVFVFMAATVALVVVFLSGVMVGRGVRLQRGGLAFGEAAGDPTLEAAPPLAAPTGTTAHGPSPASRENLSYPSQLSQLKPPDVLPEPAEDPTAAVLGRAPARDAAKVPVAKASAVKPQAVRPVAPVAADADAGAGAEAGKGYAVQVAAVRDRAEAERIAGRLKAKGYATYITSPSPGMFRVRVGKFELLDAANAAAARLAKEEQFNPWVTK